MTAIAEPKILKMSVDAAWVADKCRGLVLDGKWSRAVDVLIKGLPGMTVDQALSILRGETDLEGIDECDLVPADPADPVIAKFLANFQYMFCGVYVDEYGRFMRPYAVVTTWGPEDYWSRDPIRKRKDSYWIEGRTTKGSAFIGGTSNGTKRYAKQWVGKAYDQIDFAFRSLFYANEPDRDVVLRLKVPDGHFYNDRVRPGGETVLFKEITNYPALLVGSMPRTAQEALDDLIAKKGPLEERGYAREFPKGSYAVRSEVDDIEKPPHIDETLFDLPQTIEGAKVADKLITGRVEDARVAHRETRKRTAETVRDEMAALQATVNRSPNPTAKVDAYLAADRLAREAADHFDAYKRLILEQAEADGFFDLVVSGDPKKGIRDKTLKVPRAPFEQWAIRRTDGAHLAAPWKPVCPSGLKMFNDDPFHSDWMLGAGIDPRDWENSGPLFTAAWDARYETARRILQTAGAVLSGSGTVTGKARHLKRGERLEPGQIGIIRDAGPDYVFAAQDAIDQGSCLITENGGAVAHLVTVFREKDLRIIRVQQARKKYPDGCEITVDFARGEVTLHEGAYKPLYNTWDAIGEVENYPDREDEDDG